MRYFTVSAGARTIPVTRRYIGIEKSTRDGIITTPAADGADAEWALVLTSLRTQPGDRVECCVAQQVTIDEVMELTPEPQDVKILARAADGNVLLAMAPQTCADLHIIRAGAAADSFYILWPGDELEFGRHSDLLSDDDDDFAAYFDDFDDSE